MNVRLAYGQGYLPLDLPDGCTTVIEPTHVPGLPDEHAAVNGALETPIGTRALKDWIKADARICIVFTDITRATPNRRLIPWLLEYFLSSRGTESPF